jgi:hypothetical protein
MLYIYGKGLKAGEITCDGGLITIYTKKKTGNSNKGNQSIELSSDVIDQAQIAGINLGNTKVIIINKDDPESIALCAHKFKVQGVNAC